MKKLEVGEGIRGIVEKVNGDFVLYSHSPFSGKVILEEI